MNDDNRKGNNKRKSQNMAVHQLEVENAQKKMSMKKVGYRFMSKGDKREIVRSGF